MKVKNHCETEECCFCKERIQDNLVFQNSHFYAKLDRYPVSLGHSLVIPKRHILTLAELTDEEWVSLKPAIQDTIKNIYAFSPSELRNIYESYITNSLGDKSKTLCEMVLRNFTFLHVQPDGFNFGINQGKVAGATIEHLHMHIIPRYRGDVPDPTGGVRNVLPEVGNYRKL